MVTIFTQQKEIPTCDYTRGGIVSKKYVSGKDKFNKVSIIKYHCISKAYMAIFKVYFKFYDFSFLGFCAL